MLQHKISFTYSKKKSAVAEKFIQLFNQLNFEIVTSQHLDEAATNLNDKLSILYHLDTYVILFSNDLEEEKKAYWELISQKYFNEPNIRIVPILLESPTDLFIPLSIETVCFTDNYSECVQSAQQILSNPKSKFKEIETKLYIFHPKFLEEIRQIEFE